MNNILLIVLSLLIGLVSFVQNFNSEDMILFIVSMFIVIPGIIIGIIGLIQGHNVIEF